MGVDRNNKKGHGTGANSEQASVYSRMIDSMQLVTGQSVERITVTTEEAYMIKK